MIYEYSVIIEADTVELLLLPLLLASTVQKVDNTTHWINLYPLESAIGFPNTFPLDIVIYPVDRAIQRLSNPGLNFRQFAFLLTAYMFRRGLRSGLDKINSTTNTKESRIVIYLLRNSDYSCNGKENRQPVSFININH